MDNKEEVVYAIIDKIIGRTGKYLPNLSNELPILAILSISNLLLVLCRI